MLGDGLRDLGLRMITPEARARRAGNTCFAAADARAVQDRLAAQGVLTWGEYGRVRVSGHVHNGEADVERLLAALRRARA